ncbi:MULTISPECIES: PASTA domain-containing protein [Thermodesulfovibrio]|jgi:serine/threonine-protein kinase|uniref:PASTA domain-containing protein n=1 Tax=Thermodesulfovibrio TaxID=28261 RepID=UPI002617B43D|nr:PASTA domain-containing protein [Thermodesulfovibrio sp.]
MRKIFYILLAIIGGFITGYLSLTVFVSSGKTETPDLMGKDIVQANQILKERGLYIRIDGEEYSEMQSGTICRQDPPPQTKVKKGREVGVIVSKGLKFSVLPDVTGMQLDEAEKLLTSKGIPVEKIIYVSSKHEEKTVIAQRPEPQEGGKSVRLIVSSGKKEE